MSSAGRTLAMRTPSRALAGGTSAFTYTGDGGTGVDTITAWLDLDGEGDIDSSEPQDSATKTWTAVAATTLALTPPVDSNPVDTSHTLTATISPVGSGVQVRFHITSGPSAGLAQAADTNAAGQAQFTYSSSVVGTDVIEAWVDLNRDGTRDAGEPQQFAVKTWTAVDAANSIALTPTTDTNEVGETHTVTATISPVAPNVLVRFDVLSGPHAGETGASLTGATGTTTFSYTGDTIGTDVIRAWADLDGNGQLGTGEPQASAIKTWVAATDDDGDGDDAEKVTVCHVPPGNPSNAHTISIGAPAVSAHLAHGDTVGACGTLSSSDDDSLSTDASLASRIQVGCRGLLSGRLNSTRHLERAIAAHDDATDLEAMLTAGDCDGIAAMLGGSQDGNAQGGRGRSGR